MSDSHAAHHANYFIIFIALCICTALSTLADLIDIHSIAVLCVIVLSVSVAKALFVMMYFMHLKFEGNWKFVLLAPTTILAIGLPLALLPDVGVHYYTPDVPQQEYILEDHSLPAGGHGGHEKSDGAVEPGGAAPAPESSGKE